LLALACPSRPTPPGNSGTGGCRQAVPPPAVPPSLPQRGERRRQALARLPSAHDERAAQGPGRAPGADPRVTPVGRSARRDPRRHPGEEGRPPPDHRRPPFHQPRPARIAPAPPQDLDLSKAPPGATLGPDP